EAGAVYMPAPQTGSPMTYMHKGKQYIVVAVSGGPYSREDNAHTPPPEGGWKFHARRAAGPFAAAVFMLLSPRPRRNHPPPQNRSGPAPPPKTSPRGGSQFTARSAPPAMARS